MQEEKKTLKEKLQAVQDATAMIQNILGEVASFGERCKKLVQNMLLHFIYFAYKT